MVRECRFSSGAAYAGVFLSMIIDRSERRPMQVVVPSSTTLSVDRIVRNDLLIL